MEASDSSFYVTLRSTSSSEYYPSNTAKEFTNYFCKKIYLPINTFECGLSLLYFTVKNTPLKYKCFRNEQEKEIAILERASLDMQHLKTKSDSIFTPAADITERLLKANISLKLTESGTPNGKLFIHLLLTDEQKRNINLSFFGPYSTALGFENSMFEHDKEYVGANPKNEELFKLIEDGTGMDFNVSINSSSTVKAEEPQRYMFEELLSEINKVLLKSKVAIKYANDTIQFINNSGNALYVSLSARMLDLIGIARGTVLFGDGSIYPALGAGKWVTKPKYHLIQSDLIEPQIFGGTSRPLLRLVPIPKVVAEEVRLEFDRVQYLPVRGGEISSIQVSIQDENLNQALLTDQTVVQLHFRARQ